MLQQRESSRNRSCEAEVQSAHLRLKIAIDDHECHYDRLELAHDAFVRFGTERNDILCHPGALWFSLNTIGGNG